MQSVSRNSCYDLSADDGAAKNVAAVYDQAGNSYVAYADGDPADLFSFEGLHAYADRYLWSLLETKLRNLRATGAHSVSILDAGCGPGTWLRRIVTGAKALGFASIVARGFDVAAAQIRAARIAALDIARLPGVDLTFDIADLTDALPEADASVDITLCLYSVLSHLPVSGLPTVSAELARASRGFFVATVRSVGSTPTIFVDSIEKARHFQHDHARDQCKIELYDGSRFTLSFHLFGASELRNVFSEHFAIEDLRGLDLFHGRFALDPRWNPALPINQPFRDHLERMENTYSRDPGFMERATHLLLVGHPRRPGELLSEVALTTRSTAKAGRYR